MAGRAGFSYHRSGRCICGKYCRIDLRGIAAYFGGVVDDIMMRIVEILLSVPYLLIVILISVITDSKSLGTMLVALTLTGWCGIARIVRGQMLQLKSQEFVLAANALGVSPIRIILKHMIPNTMSLIIVAITFDIPGYIFFGGLPELCRAGNSGSADKLGCALRGSTAELHVLSISAFVSGYHDCTYHVVLHASGRWTT